MQTYYFYAPGGEFSRAVSGNFTESPASATAVKPEIVPGHRPVWNETAWIQTEDFRKFRIYKDGEESRVITELGPIPAGWSLEPPPRVPEPEDAAADELLRLKDALYSLDARYLTPRVLAGLALGDEYALAQWEAHEAQAAPLREQMSALQ
jgi:hypothetical protein